MGSVISIQEHPSDSRNDGCVAANPDIRRCL